MSDNFECCSPYTSLANVYDNLLGETIALDWKFGISQCVAEIAGNIGRCLDLGCGTGIGGTVLKNRFFIDIDGVDLSRNMLGAIPKGIYHRTFHADLVDFHISPEYDIAVIGGDVCNYLNDNQITTLLHRLKQRTSLRWVCLDTIKKIVSYTNDVQIDENRIISKIITSPTTYEIHQQRLSVDIDRLAFETGVKVKVKREFTITQKDLSYHKISYLICVNS